MTTLLTGLLPFYGQYPAGYDLAAGAASKAAASDAKAASSSKSATQAGSGSPVDIVDIRNSRLGGGFTAAADDVFALSDLYEASAPTNGASGIAGYKVALRNDPDASGSSGGGGRLLLGDQDVTGRTDFTADEFEQLHFKAGPSGTKQDLVVVAQTGTRGSDGTLRGVTDSPAVQITANVTGTRSINAAGALLTPVAGQDAAFIRVAREASIFTGLVAGQRPTLSTVGNLTAAAGDMFAMADLFEGAAPTGSNIASYKVALRSDPSSPGDGRLMLDDRDVTGRLDFTADEFERLHFLAGPSGSKQDLVVVAQTGTRGSDGTLRGITDSLAVQISAEVTGTRSINAVGALLTPASSGSDADFIKVAREATIFTGLVPGQRPDLATVGNLTAASGDVFALGSLYTATAPAGGAGIAGYKVALRSDPSAPGDGRLMLDDRDVTGRLDFTADEFERLHFVAGPSGSKQDLVVVAQTGTRGSDGTLHGITDSPAVQISASVTGTRSINAAGALLTPVTEGSDANFLRVAREATIFTGLVPGQRPDLATVGNLTAASGDLFALSGFYQGTAPSGGTVAGYKVALRTDPSSPGDGRLMLDDRDVTDRIDFTAEEFERLHFLAGPSGSKQDLVVVAQTGTRGSDGTLHGITDSPAVQISASVTGTRSINAVGALLTPVAGGNDADLVRVAREAGIFTGLVAGQRPTLTTVGNLTASAGDMFALGDLYTGTAPAGGSIAGYKVALRSDQGSPNAGRLLLGDQDVTGRLDFTAEEFGQLHFVAGPSGSKQDLVVVAQTGTRGSDGTLRGVTDSPAVQITARVTGTRSINAVGALLTPVTGGSDADFVRVAREASIFTGLVAGQRPTLATVGTPSEPETAVTLLANLLGAYQSSGATTPSASTSTASEGANDAPRGAAAQAAAAAALDVLQLYASAVGGSQTSGAAIAAQQDGPQARAAWTPLGDAEPGGFQTAGTNFTQQRFAVAAYQASQRST